jgi:hypothetical protein
VPIGLKDVLNDIFDSGDDRKESEDSIRDEDNSSRIFRRHSDGKIFIVEDGKISRLPDDD